NDTALSGLDVKIGGVQELEEQVFNVFADIAGLGEGSGVADGERHVEDFGQSTRQEGFAAAGRADQQDIALINLDVGMSFLSQAEALVVRSEEHTFELQSPDHLVCRLLLEKKKNTHRIMCRHHYQ